MQRYIPFLILILIAGYGFYNAYAKKAPETKKITKKDTQKSKTSSILSDYQQELEQIDSDEYLKQYIIDVTIHGSSALKFNKDEIMEGGFASKEDAPKIACFIMEFSGRKCKEPYPKDAALFYTSTCGDCHGNDGKGTNGAYPDLTKKEMIGITQRKEWLRSKVAQ